MAKSVERIILGIDPGTVNMGYGIIRISGSVVSLVDAGVVQLAKDKHHIYRLEVIFSTVTKLIEEFHPDELSIEEPFFGKNVQSMLKLGRAQGVAMAAALAFRIPVFGYPPRLVKQSITGKGSASKEQVAAMVQRLLPGSTLPAQLDATDAVSVALCHYFRSRETYKANTITSGIPQVEKKKNTKYTGWQAFLQDNPERTSGN